MTSRMNISRLLTIDGINAPFSIFVEIYFNLKSPESDLSFIVILMLKLEGAFLVEKLESARKIQKC